MAQAVNVNFKLDSDVKKSMEQACSDMGLSMRLLRVEHADIMITDMVGATPHTWNFSNLVTIIPVLSERVHILRYLPDCSRVLNRAC